MSKLEDPIVSNGRLIHNDIDVPVGSSAWFDWLEGNKKFKYQGIQGHFLARCEARRNKTVYWYAYRRQAGKLTKMYLGKGNNLTSDRLEEVSVSLARPHFSNHDEGKYHASSDSQIDNSFLPKTKFSAPVLPDKLVSRPRLTQQINSSLTLIFAPSGFGKSTMINDWKQTTGIPVAWLFLDKNDNHPIRFGNSLVMALKKVSPGLGQKLFHHLRISPSPNLDSEAISLLNNDLRRVPKLGLVLDDFHHINNPQIIDFLQTWFERFPPNLHLILSGSKKPMLALGKLRAQCMVTELETDDLRFTIEEGVKYLLHFHQDPPLAQDDAERLVNHTEGWVAGLALSALALEKQSNRREFIDTFSGAHIYFREYFIETVINHLSSEERLFLRKTSIVKHLTGSLCNALTGHSNGDEMLYRLWNENIFLTRLNEKDWYRYHDLFAEMLHDQLQANNSEEIPQLHQKAAQWYQSQHAPADAISHLLAAQAWEEAAALIEETALRELEQFGEDSRLLRWLIELPESVVQQHKTLLFTYLQLAYVALPRKEIESYITRLEANITQKVASTQTREEKEVLAEIQQIRKIWLQGSTPSLPPLIGSERKTSWKLLNGLYILRQRGSQNEDKREKKIFQLYKLAKADNNLFVILMAGGGYARMMAVNGNLKRSEKVAHQVLAQAIGLRGSLPATASIALAALSHVHFERYELEQALKYLSDAVEVDPDPTSTNMSVIIALLRIKIQLANGKDEDALVSAQSIRELHTRRPSGLWLNLDLTAYEAMVYARTGNLTLAEQLLSQKGTNNQHPLSDLVRAEVFLRREQFELAEQILNRLIIQNPFRIQDEPTLDVQVMLALALFYQHKINRACQVMTEAVRKAHNERFFRPFVERGFESLSLLSLILKTGRLNARAKSFIKEIFWILGNKYDGHIELPNQELVDLSTAASITIREQDVLHLLGDGRSNREIATRLCISESTVKTHLGNIYTKLSVNNRVQATGRAKELNLI